MEFEFRDAIEFFCSDTSYDFSGNIENAYDRLAVFEGGMIYRDIRHLRDTEEHYARLCA